MILILTGLSGTGKSTIALCLCEHHGFKRIRTITTRPRRSNESASEYDFVTIKTFEDMIKVGRVKYVRTIQSDSSDEPTYYGVPAGQFNLDIDYVIVLDPQGAVEFKSDQPAGTCIVIELLVPKKQLLGRVIKRSDFDEYEWLKRYAEDQRQFSEYKYKCSLTACMSNTDGSGRAVISEIKRVIKEAKANMNIKHSKTAPVVNPKGGDEYIIELTETYETTAGDNEECGPLRLYRVKGFNSLVFDENGLSKLKKYEPAPVVDEESLKAEMMLRMYRAFKLAASMDSIQLKECFFKGRSVDTLALSDVLALVSPEKFIECAEAWVVVGDEVNIIGTDKVGNVLSIDGDNVAVIFPDNKVKMHHVSKLEKTGNHINISITTATDAPENTVTIY